MFNSQYCGYLPNFVSSQIFRINTGQSGLRFIFDIKISIYRDILSRFYKQYDFNLRIVVTRDGFVIHCGNDNVYSDWFGPRSNG